MNFLENEFFLLAVTFGIFFLAKLLQKKTGHPADNCHPHCLPEDDTYQL